MSTNMPKQELEKLRAQYEQVKNRLEKENLFLANQVKRLVKAETELYQVQEQLDDQIRLYRQLTEVGKRFNATFELAEILQITIHFVIYKLNFERCLVLLRPAEGNLFQVEAMDGYYDEDKSQAIATLSLPVDEPALFPLLQGERQLMCTPECDQKDLLALGHSLGLDDYIILPLGGESKQPLGLLAAGNTAEMAPYQTRVEPDSEPMAGLVNLAGQAATAINNANFYAALRESEKKYRTLFEDSRDAIFITTPQGELVDANQAMLDLFGYTRAEIFKLNAQERYANPDDRTKFQQAIEQKGSIRDFEVRYRKKDGTEMDCLLTATLRQAEDGTALTYQGIIRDITERKRAEQLLEDYSHTLEREVAIRTQELSRALEDLKATQSQLVEAEKMAALGGLVAGVAHEINTPVGVGVTAASLLEDKSAALREVYKSGHMKRSDLEKYLNTAEQSSSMILKNLKRAAELIQSFKQVAVDQSSEERRSFALKPYLEEILLSLRPKLKRTQHTIQINGNEDLTLDSFPGVFSQIVTNLVINSLIHAYAPDEWGHISFNFEQVDGRLIFEYGDNGRGIPEENLNKIFEPFFTTRRGQGGSGLGLQIVYNLVTQKLNGTIRCESEVGSGAKFIIEVPLDRVK
jgi:PAS domain S-box-containing protein